MNTAADYVTLGNTDIRISPLGIGVWEWGDTLYWGYGRDYTEQDVRSAFKICIEAGVNFFDTAENYGQGKSERLLGQFIHNDIPEEFPVIVASKFFPFPWRLKKSQLYSALQGSLKRLSLDKLDLYQIHWPYPPIQIETWVSALADVHERGLARAVGVSNYDANQMRRAHAVLSRRGIQLASNQVVYSLLNRSIEKNGLLNLCGELGITCIAYSPLAQGVLSGKYTPEKTLPGLRGRKYPAKYLAQIAPLLKLLKEIGENHDNKSPSQVAINWVMCKGAVPIPGVKNAQQAQENIGALGWKLSTEEIELLDHASDQLNPI